MSIPSQPLGVLEKHVKPLSREQTYHHGVVPIQPMLDMSFWVQKVDDLIDLVWVGAGEWDYFVVLAHLVQKVFGVGSENVAFRFPGSVAEYLDNIDNQSRPLIYSFPEIRVWSYRQERNAHVKAGNAEKEGEILKYIVKGLLKTAFSDCFH